MNDPLKAIPLKRETYLKKTLQDVWGDLPLLLGAGLIVVVVSLPAALLMAANWRGPGLLLSALTLFPGLAGLCWVAAAVVRGIAVGIVELFRGIRRFYGRGVILGLLVVVPLLMALGTYDLLAGNPAQGWLWGPLVLQLAVVIALLLSYTHALPLMALYDLPVTTALRYAWGAAARAPVATLGSLGLFFLLCLAAWVTHGGLAPVALGIWPVFAANLSYLIVRGSTEGP